MYQGDPVLVTNIDGEQAEGEVVRVYDEPVSEVEAPYLNADSATVYDYWRGHGVDPDERTVSVLVGERMYDYPESKVEVQS
jgi:hypothetical protein